jgi:hypothetical protein
MASRPMRQKSVGTTPAFRRSKRPHLQAVLDASVKGDKLAEADGI